MKRALLALIVLILMLCGFAHAELAAPQNPAWKEGSTATATWDPVAGADYYELTVHVYDENGETLLGTEITGTSINEVDVQLQANIIIDAQEKEYSAVKLAYTVKAGVTGSNGVITYGTESVMSEKWNYTFALIKLQPPKYIELKEDNAIRWNSVQGAAAYEIAVYGCINNNAGFLCSCMVYLADISEENGLFTYDITSLLEDAYKEALTIGYIESGDTLKTKITIRCYADNKSSDYVDGDFSDLGDNYFEYISTNLIKLAPPEKILLNKNGLVNWSCVQGAAAYEIAVYGSINDDAGFLCSCMVYLADISEENGLFTYDITSLLEDAYKEALTIGYIESGDTLKTKITIRCYADDKNSDYVDGDFSDLGDDWFEYLPYIPVESLTLSPAKPIVYVGNSYRLGITITPEDAYYTSVDWSTADASTVTVDGTGLITGVKAGNAQVSAAIGDAVCTVPVTVYDISSNIEDEEVKDTAGDIIDDLVNNNDPNLGNTDITDDEEDKIRDQVQQGIWRGDEFFTDMTWYVENFSKYADNWGQIQQAAKDMNVQFAGAYNIQVEMYHKEKDGSAIHPIGCIEEFENEITFAFDLPTGMKEVQSGYTRKYVLVRVHRNEIEAIDVSVDEKKGKGHAKSDGFSDFILLYVDEPTGSVDLSGLKTLELPAFLTEIEDEAFAGIAAEVVIIPKGCTSIGSRAFADCRNLKYIVVPSGSDITPANDAFEGCTATILYR